MLYYIKRPQSDGSVKAFITDVEESATKLMGRTGILERIDSLDLEDVQGRIKFGEDVGEPNITGFWDDRYEKTMLTEDAELLDAYFEESKSLQLDRFDPQRVAFEEKRARYGVMLERNS